MEEELKKKEGVSNTVFSASSFSLLPSPPGRTALARDSMQILMQMVMQMGNAEICIVTAEQSTLA